MSHLSRRSTVYYRDHFETIAGVDANSRQVSFRLGRRVIRGVPGWPYNFASASASGAARGRGVGGREVPRSEESQIDLNLFIKLPYLGEQCTIKPHQRWRRGLMANDIRVPGLAHSLATLSR